MAGARNDRRLADQIPILGREHVGEEIDRAIAGRIGPDQRAAPFESLAGQHPSEFAGDPLVLAEHIADLAPADTNVARGDVDVGADVAIAFGLEALAKADDLSPALALGVEVRPALAAAHRQAGPCIL